MKEERTYLASESESRATGSVSDASRPRFVILKRSSCHRRRRKRKKEVFSTGNGTGKTMARWDNPRP